MEKINFFLTKTHASQALLYVCIPNANVLCDRLIQEELFDACNSPGKAICPDKGKVQLAWQFAQTQSLQVSDNDENQLLAAL